MLRARTVWEFDHLDGYINNLPKKAGAAARRAALDIKFTAQMLAPVDTGFMKANIHIQVVNPMAWEVEVGAFYGIFVEYGHRIGRDARFLDPEGGGSLGPDRRGWVPAQPFFWPAVNRVRPTFIQNMRSVVGSI